MYARRPFRRPHFIEASSGSWTTVRPRRRPFRRPHFIEAQHSHHIINPGPRGGRFGGRTSSRLGDAVMANASRTCGGRFGGRTSSRLAGLAMMSMMSATRRPFRRPHFIEAQRWTVRELICRRAAAVSAAALHRGNLFARRAEGADVRAAAVSAAALHRGTEEIASGAAYEGRRRPFRRPHFIEAGCIPQLHACSTSGGGRFGGRTSSRLAAPAPISPTRPSGGRFGGRTSSRPCLLRADGLVHQAAAVSAAALHRGGLDEQYTPGRHLAAAVSAAALHRGQITWLRATFATTCGGRFGGRTSSRRDKALLLSVLQAMRRPFRRPHFIEAARTATGDTAARRRRPFRRPHFIEAPVKLAGAASVVRPRRPFRRPHFIEAWGIPSTDTRGSRGGRFGGRTSSRLRLSRPLFHPIMGGGRFGGRTSSRLERWSTGRRIRHSGGRFGGRTSSRLPHKWSEKARRLTRRPFRRPHFIEAASRTGPISQLSNAAAVSAAALHRGPSTSFAGAAAAVQAAAVSAAALHRGLALGYALRGASLRGGGRFGGRTSSRLAASSTAPVGGSPRRPFRRPHFIEAPCPNAYPRTKANAAAVSAAALHRGPHDAHLMTSRPTAAAVSAAALHRGLRRCGPGGSKMADSGGRFGGRTSSRRDDPQQVGVA